MIHLGTYMQQSLTWLSISSMNMQWPLSLCLYTQQWLNSQYHSFWKDLFWRKKILKNHAYLHKLSTRKYILLTIYSTQNKVILQKNKKIVNTNNYDHIRYSSLYIVILTNSFSLCILTCYYEIKYYNNSEIQTHKVTQHEIRKYIVLRVCERNWLWVIQESPQDK